MSPIHRGKVLRPRLLAIAVALLLAAAAGWFGLRMLDDMENPDYPRPVFEMKRALMDLVWRQEVFLGVNGRFAASVAELPDTLVLLEEITLVIEHADSASWRAVARHKDVREACFIEGVRDRMENLRPDCEGRYQGSPY